MPIGSYASIPPLASHLLQQRPRSVLDLGIGFGMTGAAVRQWLDEAQRPYATTLYGVEIWPDYRSPLWDLYDAIFIQSIEESLQTLPISFDLVVLGDVIEHFTFQEGERVLASTDKKLNPGGFVYVATPAGPMPQGAAHGNPYETHRSAWTADDLAQRGFEIVLSDHDRQLPPAVPTLAARRQKSRGGSPDRSPQR